MKLGVLSDTHEDEMNAIPRIIEEFKRRGVEQIIHCGDIISRHLDVELFGNLPVACALTNEQSGLPVFSNAPPNGWRLTRPNDRVLYLDPKTRIYLGHKRFFELLGDSEMTFERTLEQIRREYDSVRWLFGGHTHHQIFRRNQVISCPNPGAVENPLYGYEFATVDTETGEVVFSRILPESPVKESIKIGVISDSRYVSELDPYFWKKLAEKFRQLEVKFVIHCGNIANCDIGRPEFNDFETVYYNPGKNQESIEKPGNWLPIDSTEPVDIGGYKFCVQYGLGEKLIDQSEVDMYRTSLGLISRFPGTDFILFGTTSETFLDEIGQVTLMDPGNVVKGRNYLVVELPIEEFTFYRIPMLPLDK
jgi:predicted phosphodiesterase